VRGDPARHPWLEWTWQTEKGISTRLYHDSTGIHRSYSPGYHGIVCYLRLSTFPMTGVDNDNRLERRIWISGPLTIMNAVIVNIAMLTHLLCQVFVRPTRQGQTSLALEIFGYLINIVNHVVLCIFNMSPYHHLRSLEGHHC
jgi:hypothetical protein